MELKIVSFNMKHTRIRYFKNHWSRRTEAIRAFFRAERPDVVGTQELTLSALEKIGSILPEYSWVGEGRDGGESGEYTAIFYRRDTLRVVDWGTFWLSRTPEVPSRSWLSFFRRTCTWAELENIVDGSRIRVYNTHLDHVSMFARLNGLRIINEHIAGNSGDCVLMGDFNAKPTSRALAEMCVPGAAMGGSHIELLEWAGSGRTYHGFRGRVGGRPIDYIFTTDSLEVVERRVIRDRYMSRFPSDHYPVSVILKKPEPALR